MKFTKKIMCIILSLLMVFCISAMPISAMSFDLLQNDKDLFLDVLQRSDYNFIYKTLSDEEATGCLFNGIYVQTEDGTTSADLVGTLITNVSDIVSTRGADNVEYIFNYAAYKQLSKTHKKQIIKLFINDILSTNMSKLGKQQLYNCLTSYEDAVINTYIIDLISENATPDTATALTLLSKVLVFVRVLLGIGCIVILLGLSLSFLLDTGYLLVPGIADFFTSHTSDDKGKPKLVSMNAFKSYKQGVSEDKIAFLIYLPRQVVIICLILICIFYLMTGHLGDAFLSISEMF